MIRLTFDGPKDGLEKLLGRKIEVEDEVPSFRDEDKVFVCMVER